MDKVTRDSSEIASFGTPMILLKCSLPVAIYNYPVLLEVQEP